MSGQATDPAHERVVVQRVDLWDRGYNAGRAARLVEGRRQYAQELRDRLRVAAGRLVELQDAVGPAGSAGAMRIGGKRAGVRLAVSYIDEELRS